MALTIALCRWIATGSAKGDGLIMGGGIGCFGARGERGVRLARGDIGKDPNTDTFGFNGRGLAGRPGLRSGRAINLSCTEPFCATRDAEPGTKPCGRGLEGSMTLGVGTCSAVRS